MSKNLGERFWEIFDIMLPMSEVTFAKRMVARFEK
jgi:hypothetical protein